MTEPLDYEKLAFDMEARSPATVSEQVAYALWGAVITTTKAFERAEVTVHPEVQRVMLKVTLRWWARFTKFEKARRFWLRRAEHRAKPYCPEGWKLLIYFGEG